MGVNRDAVVTLFLTGAIAVLLLRLDTYARGVPMVGTGVEPNPQEAGNMLARACASCGGVARSWGIFFSHNWGIFFGWAVSFERCYSGRLAVLGRNGSAWAVLNLICGWRRWNLLGRRRHSTLWGGSCEDTSL